MENIETLERRLWSAADQLRSNSKLTSTEYSMPVLGLIFLRHAYNRFELVKVAIEKNLPKRGGVARPLTKDDFQAKSALFLRNIAQYDYLLNLPGDKDCGEAIIKAMESIEGDYPYLAGVLPKDYQIFDSDLLSSLLKTFNDEALKTATGDVFGHIYEYFLMKFAMAGAQDNGEFFTPVSLVQTIVNVIEPDHGIVLDPACGSGGMFVQTSHFLETAGKDTHRCVTFFGQEKTTATIRLAKMNLAVHGLEGAISEGNTFYEDKHNMLNKADFVMANPPFNVDEVDAEKIKNDVRLPFGLPGVNKTKKVSNGNYLWISYFYSYLNDKGRAGFVMSSQASSAGHGEKDVRERIVKSGHADAMISIRSNFFYTRTVPCELWFFNKNKPKELLDKVLMLDARNIFRKVTRKVYDFSPEQLKNITAIFWLYRGKTDAYLKLITSYFNSICKECHCIPEKVQAFDKTLSGLSGALNTFSDSIAKSKDHSADKKKELAESLAELKSSVEAYSADRKLLFTGIEKFISATGKKIPSSNAEQIKARAVFDAIAESIKGLIKQIDMLYKIAIRSVDIAEKELSAKDSDSYDVKAVNKNKKALDEIRKDAVEQLKLAAYFHKQIHWLQIRFPDAVLCDVEGLVKLVSQKEIEKNDWSLTPGRYVGVAAAEEDDSDFEEQLRDIHVELGSLNEEAVELAKKIAENFEELGI